MEQIMACLPESLIRKDRRQPQENYRQAETDYSQDGCLATRNDERSEREDDLPRSDLGLSRKEGGRYRGNKVCS
jgi:hypothetical protein